ncbi:unnamed protein product [Durusdinium trenchii]|uniref:Uncharacterized protein n=2 Tax=Durusdinium trenchii TaxID=1381693 RepID=A0ABP0PJQ5_9DINO
MFGQLRSVQSQMSVEAFCRLSAQRMLKEVENKFKSQKTRADHPKRAPKLSEQKFKAAAQSAYDAAIELVSWAANVETDSLRQYYEESVESLWFSEESTAEVIADHEEDEDETLPEEEVARSSTDARCGEYVIKEISAMKTNDQADERGDEAECGDEAASAEPDAGREIDVDLRRVEESDKKGIREWLDADSSDGNSKFQGLPRTLGAAMWLGMYK